MGLYKENKQTKTGTIIECPVCHKKFKKIQYSQAFCCVRCKDKYHNMVDGDRHRYVNDDSLDCLDDEKWSSDDYENAEARDAQYDLLNW